MSISIELDINMVYYKMFELKCYTVKIIICIVVIQCIFFL